MSSRPLTEELWASSEDVYEAILDHPFIAGLTDGSLEREAFRFYLVQDSHYLREYARALALLAARAPSEPEILLFARNASGAIEVERELHESIFRDVGIGPGEIASTPLAPTNLAYTSYLLASCYGCSYVEALAAVLPCFWIYREVGRTLLERGSPDPLYRRWIETYGGEEYGAIVADVLAAADRVGEEAGAAERQRACERFRRTSVYEWMFWDMGYRQERWPL